MLTGDIDFEKIWYVDGRYYSNFGVLLKVLHLEVKYRTFQNRWQQLTQDLKCPVSERDGLNPVMS